MKAVQLPEMGKPPVINEVPFPQPESGKALIRISHAALNHRDLWIAKGKYAKIKYPVIPGSDLCGWIDQRRIIVNPGFYWGEDERVQSKEFQILGLPDQGSFAEAIAIPSQFVYDAPKHLNDAEAAALPLAGITAFRAFFTKCNPVKGENLFLTGIGGGVALQVLQFATAYGVNVYVSSSDDAKIQKAIALGARAGVNYQNENWDEELLSMSGGVHMIIDSAGGATFQKLLRVCLPAARICIYGGTQGNIPELSPQVIYWKQLTITGSVMGTQSEFQQMLNFVERHDIIPIVDSIFPMKDISAAFNRMERKEQFGKIVLKINS